MLYCLGMVGIVAFAVTGVLAAGRRDMDIFSIVLLGVVTALGGGTLRDVLLDNHPIFWIADLTYLWFAIISSIVTFFSVRLFSRLLKLFVYLDTFGMALFSILATENTIIHGHSYLVAIIMGLATGISGGILRDVLASRKPLVLRREFYATPALLGTFFYVALYHYYPVNNWPLICAVLVIIVLRICAIHYGLYYPKWLTYTGNNNEDNY